MEKALSIVAFYPKLRRVILPNTYCNRISRIEGWIPPGDSELWARQILNDACHQTGCRGSLITIMGMRPCLRSDLPLKVETSL